MICDDGDDDLACARRSEHGVLPSGGDAAAGGNETSVTIVGTESYSTSYFGREARMHPHALGQFAARPTSTAQ